MNERDQDRLGAFLGGICFFFAIFMLLALFGII